MNKSETREMVSALADGELHAAALAGCLENMRADPALQSDWAAWHLIGDVLRSPDLASATPPAVFLSRLRDGLQAESVPVQGAPALLQVQAPVADSQVKRPAANDSDFRWKLVAGFASLAAVAAIAWNAVGMQDAASVQPQLASAPAPVQPGPLLASGESNVMIRDARLDELMAAHRQFGGGAALKMPSEALRNATFESPAR